MKSHEKNLKIHIGGNASVASETNENDGSMAALSKDDGGGHVRWYHSAVMAQQSTYIDAMLASPMKESQSNEISFPDISLETWELMMKYLLASEARKMTVDDVLIVAEYYDQFDFVHGRLLCDQVLSEYFRGMKQQEIDMSLDVDTMVEAVALSFNANLSDSFALGSEYIKEKLTVHKIPFGPSMFHQHHIEKLVPLIMHFIGEDSTFRHGLNPWDDYTESEILSPLFPRLFVSEWKLVDTDRVLKTEFLSHIILSGTSLEADGSFKSQDSTWLFGCDRFGEIEGEWFGFSIELRNDAWTILARSEEGDDWSEKVLWENPFSGNLPLPPKVNWRPVHAIAAGRQPTIQYIRQRR